MTKLAGVLPIASPNVVDREPGRAWSTFMAEVRARGLDAPVTGRVVGELAVHTSIMLGGAGGYLWISDPSMRLLCLPLFVVGILGVATNTHTSAHGGTSRLSWVNEALGLFGYSFVCTYSLTGWRIKHNQEHHAHPNVVGKDPDHEFMPYFALSAAHVEQASPRLQAYYRRQWLVFPFAIAFMGVRMRMVALRYFFRELRSTPSRRRRASFDGIVLLLSYVTWFLAPLLTLPLRDIVILHLARSLALSYGLFVIFAPAHIPSQAPHLRGADAATDPMLRQIAVTLDYRCSPILSFFLSGLDHQIEHHVVPGVAHVHYKKMAPLLASFCRERGWPYHVMTWGGALRETWATIRHPKRAVSDLEKWIHEVRVSPMPGRSASGRPIALQEAD